MKISKNLVLNQKDIQNTSKTNAAKNRGVALNSKGVQTKEISIKLLLDSLFNDLVGKQKSNDTVLHILKDENILQNIKNTTLDIKSAIINLKSKNLSPKSLLNLENLLLDIDKIDSKSLQRYIGKSGIFLESKLANITKNPKEQILNDTKAIFLQLKDEITTKSKQFPKDTLAKIDKVLTNINYYQLLSLSSAANILYLPLMWEGLDEGQISIKKLKKKRYFCEINLKLKEYGQTDLLIMLFEDVNINISIFVQNQSFLARIRENLQILKQSINSVGLSVSNLYLYDSVKNKNIKKETKKYSNDQQIGSGVSFYV